MTWYDALGEKERLQVFIALESEEKHKQVAFATSLS
ncbi:protein of unknown function [Vibrio tapetis subsp. tapetis]|uniref:Uncharacterized protein n=1 Tax=Vibrio tapetis subsp. tapetis TaxID=1671868 RepID=A0A2N8ZIA0_9VIBR|nr:protein of unknown function [Vibrio tapetis subsp. tapetis]